MTRSTLRKLRNSSEQLSQRAVAKRVEALLESERMENLANYLRRGRPLRPLPDETLKRRWVAALRREIKARIKQRTEMENISAELSLRGIQNVPLPPDVKKMIMVDLAKSLGAQKTEAN